MLGLLGLFCLPISFLKSQNFSSSIVIPITYELVAIALLFAASIASAVVLLFHEDMEFSEALGKGLMAALALLIIVFLFFIR